MYKECTKPNQNFNLASVMESNSPWGVAASLPLEATQFWLKSVHAAVNLYNGSAAVDARGLEPQSK